MILAGRWSRAMALSLSVATIVPGSVASQTVIRGQVRADSSRTAIPFAQVDLSSVGKTTQASISGVYTLDSVPAGRQRLTARAVGYSPLEVLVDVAANDTLRLDLLLARKVTQLAPLVATAPRPGFTSGRMAEFEERRRKAVGRFLDRAALAALEPAPLSDGLRRMTGVQLIRLPWPCLGFAAVSGRGTGSGNRTAFRCGAKPVPPYCFLSVFVDGLKIWEFGDDRQPPDVSGITTGELEAVEVYRGPSEVPMAFDAVGAECGVIVLWTRTGDGAR